MTTSTHNMSAQPLLPGRLGNPDRVLKTDPRADPRLVAACAPLALDGAPPPIPVHADSPFPQGDPRRIFGYDPRYRGVC